VDLCIGQRPLARGRTPQQRSEDGALAAVVIGGALAVAVLDLVKADSGTRGCRQVVPAVDQARSAQAFEAVGNVAGNIDSTGNLRFRERPASVEDQREDSLVETDVRLGFE